MTCPSKILAFFQQQYPNEFIADEEVGCEYEQFYKPELCECCLAGFVEHEEQCGCDEFGVDFVVIDIDVEFGAFATEIIEEENNTDEVVDEHYEGVEVVFLDDDADEEEGDVAHAEVGEVTHTFDKA